MSQYPPPPPHGNYPPQQGGYPPPPPQGYPPQGGYPQNPGYGGAPGGAYAMPGPKTSAAAVISLICGVLGCIPFVTSLLAVLFGFVGIAKTGKPHVSGRGLAIAGLILGLLGLAGWGGFSALMYVGYKQAMAQLDTEGRTFVNSVVKGDFSAAKQVTTDNITQQKLQNLQAQLQSLGEFKGFDVQLSKGIEEKIVNGEKTIVLGGVAEFANGKRDFSITLVGRGEVLKIHDFELK